MKLAAASATLLALVATPAFADAEGPITHTDQLIVVTPNPPVVIQNGAPGAAPVAPATSTAAVAAAPQNEDWDNVSHINGTPVKVGERGDYLRRFRKTTISTNPVGWLVGIYGVSLSHAVHENVAIRVDGNLFNDAFGSNSSGYEVGATAQLYFRRAHSGPFLEAGVLARELDSTDHYYDCYDCGSSDPASFGPQVMFGWSSMFDSGFTLSAAFGLMRNLNETSEYGEDVEPVGYFRVGYAF